MEKFKKQNTNNKTKMKDKYHIYVKPEFVNMYVYSDYICGKLEYDNENNVFIIEQFQRVGKYCIDHITIEEINGHGKTDK